jgi:hypothetical protein
MMASQRIHNHVPDGAFRAWAAQDFAVRLTGALLALAVSAIHVADQGGVNAFTSPDWIGWGYRLIEIGGVLTAIALLAAPVVLRPPHPAWPALTRLGWAAGVLLGTGPFLAYVASRTVGIPGDPGDVGNWGYWVGTVSLFVEAALVVLSVMMLFALRQTRASAPAAVTEAVRST